VAASVAEGFFSRVVPAIYGTTFIASFFPGIAVLWRVPQVIKVASTLKYMLTGISDYDLIVTVAGAMRASRQLDL
jgi:hypothetical protein